MRAKAEDQLNWISWNANHYRIHLTLENAHTSNPGEEHDHDLFQSPPLSLDPLFFQFSFHPATSGEKPQTIDIYVYRKAMKGLVSSC